MERLEERLAALAGVSSVELRAEWSKVWREPPPPLGHDLLRRGIAWKLQEREYGGLPRKTVRELDRLARLVEQGKPLGFERTAKPGTRLVRQWRGKTYHVLVLDDGYLFEDRCYPSLSRIAAAITGAKWSGPRFFGLTGKEASEPPRG